MKILKSGYISIAEACTALKVSIDTIRRWEKKGLIKAKRDHAGHRIFDVKELRRLEDKINGKGDVNYHVLKSKNKSKYKVVELFAGCGGLALGFENAGLDCELLVEIDKTAVETLKKNRPSWKVIGDDITNVNFKKIKADIVAGGFPCQAFSYAGNRRGFEDTRGTLFFEFARAVKEINPKIVVGENVRGLERHDKGRTLSTMINVLEDFGYLVSHKILKAQYFDVAQKRERLVIIGVRKDLNKDIAFPKEKNYTVSLREALREVPKSFGQNYTKQKKTIMQKIPQGGYWRDLPQPIRTRTTFSR
jgi:DNA (cytosine-5)-methyltransferase 1